MDLEFELRWQHPTLGLIMPDAFIPLAEEAVLIVSIDRWALVESCQWRRTWRERHPTLLPMVICVNLSLLPLRKPDLIPHIAGILAETDLSTASLEIEIIERVLIDERVVLPALRTLKELGLRLAIDDFGTGNTSLAYLSHWRSMTSVLAIPRWLI